MHERRFNREIERLRDPERIAWLEVERVVNLTLEELGGVKKVLDVGTGSGVFAEQFAARDLLVSGVDVNPEMLLAARQYVPAGVFNEGTAEKLPYADGAFDVVFMGLLLHETDDLLSALREARRTGIMRTAVLEWPDEEQSFGPPREHRLTADKVETAARQAGFKRVEQLKLEQLVLYRLDC